MSKRITCPECQHAFEPRADDLGEANGANRVEPAVAEQRGARDSANAELANGHSTNGHLSLGEQARRSSKPSLARLVRWVGAGTLLLVLFALMGTLTGWESWSNRRTHRLSTTTTPTKIEANQPTSKVNAPANKVVAVQPSGDSSTNGATDSSANPAPPAAGTIASAEVVELIENSVVKIESSGSDGANTLGTGFVIDARGLIATNYHVIADAVDGRVRFKSGAVYDIEGYAAVQPADDLAILKLRDPPSNLQVPRLRYEDDPPPLSSVVAIGHPRGVAFSLFDGKVSRVLTTAELSVESQRFLERYMNTSADHQWIQHTAKISEGNSGGPLINSLGEVVGVNMWVDNQASFAYALHVVHLHRLQQQLFEKVAPLERYASKEAQLAALKRRLTAENIQRLFQDVRAMNWHPQSPQDYDRVQQLAWAVTATRFAGNLPNAGTFETKMHDALVPIVDQIESTLRKEKWNAFGQLTITNELAAEQVGKPLAGVYFFGTVDRVVEGEDGSRGVLMQLAGFDQMLFVPLDGNLLVLAPGTHCLVLGVNDNGRTVRYGDNPLKLVSAPVIVSRTILPLAD
jgi:S1-C subfamily serine protease